MVAIIGGGISGLAAAYELSRRGIPFQLFEASHRFGGLIRTDHTQGFTIEAGADSMLAQKRAGIELCEELGLAPRLMPMTKPRGAFVLHRGRLIALPAPSVLGIPATITGVARYGVLSPMARVRLAIEPLIPPGRNIEDESIGAFFRRRFGARTVDAIAQPLLGGIHAGDVDALSVRALAPRLAAAEASGSVLGWVRRTARASEADGAFRSLRAGMGELVEAIVAALPAGAAQLDTRIEGLSRHDRMWRVTSSRSSTQHTAVILACPASIATPLLAPLDPEAGALCERVRYVSTASVSLGWPREAVRHPLAGSGFVVARRSNDLRITACTWVSSKWEQRAPDGHVLLRAYIGGAHDASAVDLDDDALKRIATRELSQILSINGSPGMAQVHRWRGAGAQHEVGHLARIAALESRLARLPGLFVTGSGFRSIGIPDCVADGRTVAARAGAFLHAH